MNDTISQEERRPVFLDRKIRLRWTVYIIGLLIIAALVFYGMTVWQMGNVRSQARKMMRNEIKAKGKAIAQTIAVTSRDDIRNGNFDKLQEYFADLVRQQDLRYIIIMKPNGEAAVHTDNRLRGVKLKDDPSKNALRVTDAAAMDVKDRELYDVAVPVMAFTRRIAVVRVGISYTRANEAFEQNKN